MRIRQIDKRTGLVAVHENGRDRDYYFTAGRFSVSYSIDRKNAQGRAVRMHRALNPASSKAAEIRAILDSSE